MLAWATAYCAFAPAKLRVGLEFWNSLTEGSKGYATIWRARIKELTAISLKLKLAITDSPLPWLSQKQEGRSGIMVDQEVFDNQLKRDRFPFPSEGDITLAVRNANYTLGPVMLHLVMKP